jgi:MtN3 and saliva related transmembrane protein
METLIGFTAAALTTLAFLPQVIKTWKSRSTGDISLSMFMSLTVGVLLWTVYGILISSPPVIVANSMVLVLAGIILVLKIKHG